MANGVSEDSSSGANSPEMGDGLTLGDGIADRLFQFQLTGTRVCSNGVSCCARSAKGFAMYLEIQYTGEGTSFVEKVFLLVRCSTRVPLCEFATSLKVYKKAFAIL